MSFPKNSKIKETKIGCFNRKECEIDKLAKNNGNLIFNYTNRKECSPGAKWFFRETTKEKNKNKGCVLYTECVSVTKNTNVPKINKKYSKSYSILKDYKYQIVFRVIKCVYGVTKSTLEKNGLPKYHRTPISISQNSQLMNYLENELFV